MANALVSIAAQSRGRKVTEQEIDKALSVALGIKPVIVWIATNDGGKSCSMHSESRTEMIGWLEKYSSGMLKGYSLGSWERYPNFCTDPAESKRLRNHMQDMGWWCQLRNAWHPKEGYTICWSVFVPHGTGFNGHSGNWKSAATEEMAVALAALKAFGVEVSA